MIVEKSRIGRSVFVTGEAPAAPGSLRLLKRATDKALAHLDLQVCGTVVNWHPLSKYYFVEHKRYMEFGFLDD